MIPPIQAGLGCRCPRCGQGPLYSALLTVAERCTVCDLRFGPHDSGDGPSFFAILLLGVLVVPLALWFESAVAPALWVHMLVWPPVIIGLATVFLRLMKATLVAYHFKNLRHRYDE